MHSPSVIDKGDTNVDTKQRQRRVSAVRVDLLQIKEKNVARERKYYHDTLTHCESTKRNIILMHSPTLMDGKRRHKADRGKEELVR